VLPDVAALNNPEQAVPPLELEQDASALANVFSLLVPISSVEGFPDAGDVPVLAGGQRDRRCARDSATAAYS